MKKIKLTQGRYAIVDDEDYKYLNKYKWCFGSNDYAMRVVDKETILMHRVINKTPESMITDHINHDKLDNRKNNLRTCTKAQNRINAKMNKNNNSGYKGVTWNKLGRKWRAYIRINGKSKHLGYFDNKEEANKAYNIISKKYFGEFSFIE